MTLNNLKKNIFFISSVKEFDIIPKKKLKDFIYYPINFRIYIFLKEKKNLNIIEPS